MKPVLLFSFSCLTLSLCLAACSTPPTGPVQPLGQSTNKTDTLASGITPVPKGPRPVSAIPGNPSGVALPPPAPLNLPHLTTGAQVPGTGFQARPNGNFGNMPTPFAVPASAFASLAPKTEDISTIEQTTFNGKIFGPNGEPLDGVKIIARSLNASVSFTAETTSTGGAYAFNNAPSGIQVEIVAIKSGFTPRKRVEVLKSNKQGDPNANKYDFGSNSTNGTGSLNNAISDMPEVVFGQIERSPTATTVWNGVKLKFSEPMNKQSVEDAIRIFSSKNADKWDKNSLIITWNSDDSEITLERKAGTEPTGAIEDYEIAFDANNGAIQDKSGTQRTKEYFKLTDGPYEATGTFQRLLSMRPVPTPTPVPTPLPTPIPTPTPTPEPTPIPIPTPTPVPTPPPATDTDFFYFSYDDSASTAGVELTKNALQNNQQPNPAWARPWEFLNFERFNPQNQQSTGLFKVSLGMWQHADAEYPGYVNYELGAHVSAPYLDKINRRNVVLTFVVDVSGSMDDDHKMEMARLTLQEALKNFKPGDVVSLVKFSDFADIVLQGQTSPADYLNAVSGLKTEGGTNLNAGIDKGYEVARKLYDPTKINRVIILTDAHANVGEVDPSKVARHTSINNAEGIYFSGLGFGQDFNEAYLNQLTEAGRGAYFSVVNQRDAKLAVQERFMALINVVARNVQFRLDYPRALMRFKSASEESSRNASEVQPTNFSYNTSQFFLEQFISPADQAVADKPMRLSILYTDPVSGQKKVEMIEKRISEILGQDVNNIKDAHLVTLLTSLIKGEVSRNRAQKEVTTLLSDYTSPLNSEYRKLIERWTQLAPSAVPTPFLPQAMSSF